jgi:hypothetical protein
MGIISDLLLWAVTALTGHRLQVKMGDHNSNMQQYSTAPISYGFQWSLTFMIPVTQITGIQVDASTLVPMTRHQATGVSLGLVTPSYTHDTEK